MKPNNKDPFLEKRLEKYDNWLKAGKIHAAVASPVSGGRTFPDIGRYPNAKMS